ncbi:hypothetical protein [Pedobacter sp. Leaf170]|uniref:hypothetical protein n=1 Tax=Pedobacter sp. Leaf170 TaxID=2876558 RepID=UPI001E3511DA|nr:hypothetical protein [Pedobacter sp. Leaf170]
MNALDKNIQKIDIQIEALRKECDSTNNVLIDALESTITDLTAANHVINLYAKMSLDLGQIIKLTNQKLQLYGK